MTSPTTNDNSGRAFDPAAAASAAQRSGLPLSFVPYPVVVFLASVGSTLRPQEPSRDHRYQ